MSNRPPKQTVKKGKPSWKPASAMEVIHKEPGYRYRWANKEPVNLAKKELEGFEMVSGLQADASKHVDPERIGVGKQMTTIRERHDCVLMRITEDLAEARDEFMNTKTAQKTLGLTAHLKEEARAHGTDTHGKITIGSRLGEQVLE